MPKSQAKRASPAAGAKTAAVVGSIAAARTREKEKGTAPARASWNNVFSRMACLTAVWAGKPIVFLFASLSVVIWATTGPLFGYSDTWQLVINTSTTIITFLMVFLIQHTQNRDTLALQLKLSELIFAVSEAENRLAAAEDLSEDDLEQLHEEFRRRADAALGSLNERRSQHKTVSAGV